MINPEIDWSVYPDEKKPVQSIHVPLRKFIVALGEAASAAPLPDPRATRRVPESPVNNMWHQTLLIFMGM